MTYCFPVFSTKAASTQKFKQSVVLIPHSMRNEPLQIIGMEPNEQPNDNEVKIN